VPVDVGRELVAHVTGIRRCGSPWACPVCAPVVRERRALEIDRGLSAHLAGGGGAVFVTLTLRHHRGDELGPRLALVSEALHECLKGAAWKRRAARLEYLGAIRATEVTWSEANGWHPHVHAVLLLDRPIGDAEADDLRAWLLGRWGGVCERRGFGTLSAAHGVDVQVVRSAPELAGYLTKVDGGWGAGHELARGDVKAGRVHGLVPAQLLGEFIETGEVRFKLLWQEYERATFGKRAIVWSAGLRRRLLGEEVEESDEALASSEGMEPEFVRFLVEKDHLWEAAKAGTVGDLLSQIEAAAEDYWSGVDHAEVEKAEGFSAEGRPDSGEPGRAAAVGGVGHGRSSWPVGSRAIGVDGPGVPDLPGGAVALVRWTTSPVGGLAASVGVVDPGAAAVG
jgi:hypothetical protein